MEETIAVQCRKMNFFVCFCFDSMESVGGERGEEQKTFGFKIFVDNNILFSRRDLLTINEDCQQLL